MKDYRYPEQDMRFVLDELVGIERLAALPGQEELSAELVYAVLEEAGRFASEVLAPLNKAGDRHGSILTEGKVTTAPGFRDAYRQFADAGWVGMSVDSEAGGQGLPNVLGTAVSEIWQSANLAFSLNPLLSQGAIEALHHHASAELQQRYLLPLVSGQWTGTMNLTEPDAGSDLAAIKARAVPQGDHYLITGQKIFITWGEHDCTDNIVHLVLARMPDAPAGVKGISLFVVPKFLPDEADNYSIRNDLQAVALEHKLGIHGSPTCVMSYGDNGGAVGYLVGQPHQGIICMFTMMNHARQGVGLQGLGIAERAYQQALAYAAERVQGVGADRKTRVSINQHADVQRMLLTMKAATEAMRALALTASAEVDFGRSGPLAAEHQARTSLLTPIVKGWITELAQEVTYLGVQVHGGMGFIEETGAAQHYRDARILTIYEGTTGIQALDLVGRKCQSDGGQALRALHLEMQEDVAVIRGRYPRLAAEADSFAAALQVAQQARDWVLNNSADNAAAVQAGSVAFMMLQGYVTGGWLLLKSAACALEAASAERLEAGFAEQKVQTACFFNQQLLPRVFGLWPGIEKGYASLAALAATQFPA
ncbi:acyl-CoA dehydrogenase [Pokkaliibacter sp. MBI-7]|uniref:acyl-CoA dehydrogenase n=1 Tax=Pokkaliibacter sp. MBI-7 TaxID=3040600 RepID=UPI00244A4634|nr:acyl-CoA dehydrogenase [Pokkaliibacter sp. MBI-7]MDH2433924.1 acyl-CoA dehydrogenase [Pokkaliibacter sp. MBI-7]